MEEKKLYNQAKTDNDIEERIESNPNAPFIRAMERIAVNASYQGTPDAKACWKAAAENYFAELYGKDVVVKEEK